MHRPWSISDGAVIRVPTGYCACPREIVRPPRSIAERTFGNITPRWTALEHGGHFPAMEQPDALAREIRAFFKPYREQA